MASVSLLKLQQTISTSTGSGTKGVTEAPQNKPGTIRETTEITQDDKEEIESVLEELHALANENQEAYMDYVKNYGSPVNKYGEPDPIDEYWELEKIEKKFFASAEKETRERFIEPEVLKYLNNINAFENRSTGRGLFVFFYLPHGKKIQNISVNKLEMNKPRPKPPLEQLLRERAAYSRRFGFDAYAVTAIESKYTTPDVKDWKLVIETKVDKSFYIFGRKNNKWYIIPELIST